MKTKLGTTFITAVMAAVMLAGCVSSKKYKASQSSVQQLRNDSTRLAQEVSTLNQNVQTLEQKNKTLQQSFDSTSTNFATQQKSLDYYTNYFSKQQTSMTQIGDELKTALTNAGVTGDAIMQTEDGIYINLDESNAFKKNSATTTATGKQALNGVADVLKNHPDVNVTIASGDDATSQNAMTNDNVTTSNNANADNPADNKTTTDNAADKKVSDQTVTAEKTSDKKVAVSSGKSTTVKTKSTTARKSYAGTKSKTSVKRKTTTKTAGAEGYTTSFSTKGTKRKSSALKTGRINTVANNLLEGGVQKVNVMIKQSPTGTSDMTEEKNNVKIIVSPTMTDFKPDKSASASKLP